MAQKIRRFIIQDTRYIPPFNEPASELSFMGKQLKLHQEDLFLEYFGDALEAQVELPLQQIADLANRDVKGPCLVVRDSIYFDREYLHAFYRAAERLARKTGQGVRAAYAPDDPVFTAYVHPLTRGFEPYTDPGGKITCYMADMWYFPDGYAADVVPMIIPTDPQEKGFYSVPHYMSQQGQALTHILSERVLISVESWVHVYFANTVQGVMARGSRFEEKIKHSNFLQLRVLWRAVLEWRQLLSSSALVKIGQGTQIHPSATVLGPTTIGDNCYIGPGAVIDNCHIGDNVTIDQGCQVMTSVIGTNSFFPFRASCYFSVFMDNCILAQNTCVQMCVIGRNTFIGAGNTFTDFNLLPVPIRAMSIHGLEDVGQIVLGGCVGHNCRIGSGFVLFPARMVESDTVLAADPANRVLMRNVTFDQSAHHAMPPHVRDRHPRHYPRQGEQVEEESW
ncbi:MAG: multidrug transporter [Anaerolineae bacterium]|nr:multidrug transporter [Anaerolineae bacterium]